jgi:GDP-L-fucose synthase
LLNDLKQKIYVVGHKGMVGSAIVRELEPKGYTNLVYRTRDKLDLTNQATFKHFFDTEN